MDAESKEMPLALHERLPKVVAIFIPIIALSVPVLYVVGRVYREAYWHELGIPSGIISYNFEDHVYAGFVAIANGLFRLVVALPLGALGSWFLAILALALMLALLVSLKRWLGKELYRFTRWIERTIKDWRAKKDAWHVQVGVPLLIVGQWLNGVFLAFLIPVFILALVIAGVTKAGKAEARKHRDYTRESVNVLMGNDRPILHLRNQESDQSGVLVQCTPDWCVMSRRGDLIAVKVEDVARIDHCPKQHPLKDGAMACDPKSSVQP